MVITHCNPTLSKSQTVMACDIHRSMSRGTDTLAYLGTLLLTVLGAAAGSGAWLNFLHHDPLLTSVEIRENDFDSPALLPLTLGADAVLTVQVNASRLVHNPRFGEEGWTLGAGVGLTISVDSEVCAQNETHINRPIIDGRLLIQTNVSCGPMELTRGQHFIRIDAKDIGNCLPLEHVPEVCNTNRIRGSYTLIE